MSSSSSSTPKLEGTIVGMEESKEKAMENENSNERSPQEVISENKIGSSSSGSGVIRRKREIMRFYPSKSNKIYNCQFCRKGFSTSQALGGHQNAHKQEREWDKKRKEMEANFPGLAFLNPYLDKPHLLLGGYSQDALSNENHLGITLDLIKPLGNSIYPSFNNGLTSGTMNMTIVPRMTPTSFFPEKTSTYGSSSRGSESLPSIKNMRPLLPRTIHPFSLPPTTHLSSNLFPKENVLNEENFISKIGTNNVVEIDDDDQSEEGKSKNWDIDLSLSL